MAQFHNDGRKKINKFSLKKKKIKKKLSLDLRAQLHTGFDACTRVHKNKTKSQGK